MNPTMKFISADRLIVWWTCTGGTVVKVELPEGTKDPQAEHERIRQALALVEE